MTTLRLIHLGLSLWMKFKKRPLHILEVRGPIARTAAFAAALEKPGAAISRPIIAPRAISSLEKAIS